MNLTIIRELLRQSGTTAGLQYILPYLKKDVAFSPNTMPQFFLNIYAAEGIDGIFSHTGGRIVRAKFAAKVCLSE